MTKQGIEHTNYSSNNNYTEYDIGPNKVRRYYHHKSNKIFEEYKIVDGKYLLKYSMDNKGVQRRYYDNGRLQYVKFPNEKEYYWYENGKKERKISDGIIQHWHENGVKSYEKLPDGTTRMWNENKQISYEYVANTSIRNWTDTGELIDEKLADGTERIWFENGQLATELLPDGTNCCWNENGVKVYERLPDGTKRYWYDNGVKSYEKTSDGNEVRYDIDGSLISHRTNGKDDTIKFKALKKVAERRIMKNEKTKKENPIVKHIYKKLDPISKSIQIAKAIKEIQNKQ